MTSSLLRTQALPLFSCVIRGAKGHGNFCRAPKRIMGKIPKRKGTWEGTSWKAKWIFCLLHLQLAGLRNTLDIQVNRPLLMFWPTDDAVNSLPGDFQNKLRDPLKVLELIHFIQYHVVAHIQVRARGIFLCFIVNVVPCNTMFGRSPKTHHFRACH